MKFPASMLAVVVLASHGFAAESTDDVFEKKVHPIFAKSCLSCHSTKLGKVKSDLDLDTKAAVLAGAASGPVLVAGKSKESLLLSVVRPDGSPHMPPKGQLSDAEIQTLAAWVDGLQASAAGTKKLTSDHWAFQKPVKPAIPAVKDAWVRSPIDAFILASLKAKGLEPSPIAAKADLLRRAYFDLIGLPPTPEQVQAFLKDESPDAYAKVIDTLLASPQYGERWGRHWLDLVRYADSGGFHDDLDRPNAWRYRDYVIKSFNQDKPYPEFIREQLAGDEIAPESIDALVATAFARHGPSNDDNMGKTAQDKEKYRVDQLDGIISTTSSVFLGLTLGCARCHDHKYDPITQRDYYSVLAIFDNTDRVELPLPGSPPPPATAKPSNRKPLTPGIMALVEKGGATRTTRLLWRGDVGNPGPEVEPAVPAVLSPVSLEFPTPAKGAKTGRRTILANWIASPENPLTYRVLANRVWQHHFGRGLVFTPGNFGKSGAAPSHPALLDYLATELAATGGKLKPLHRAIMLSSVYQQSSTIADAGQKVDPDNTLLWRQNKRRLEAEAIRDGILAVAGKLNATAGGPGFKPRIRADLLPASQRNKWPVVAKEGPEHWRRSVYIYVKRQLLLPVLELFDAPTTTDVCDLRPESVVPTQALVLMNDEFVNDQAGYFAERVKAAGPDASTRAERALWLALGRPPTATRIADATEFLAKQVKTHTADGRSANEAETMALTDLCHVLLNCNEFVYLD